MRLRALIMLGLAAVLGVAAVYLARGWLQSQTEKVVAKEERVDLTTVVVAKRPLSLGDEITREFVREVPWPAGVVPQGSFRKIDELVKSGSEARVALRSIQTNEPVLKSKVSGFGGKATMSTLIDKDMRGVTIRVNDVLGVAGFVMPGDHVDVLLTRKRNKDEHITDVLIQDVKVLGIDQDANDNKDAPKVVRAVTLEVSPDQGQKLALASAVGTLSLSLRQSMSTGAVAHRTIRERDLVDDNLIRSSEPSQPKPQPKPAAPAKIVRKASPFTSVNVVRALKATTQEVVIEHPTTHRRAASTPPTASNKPRASAKSDTSKPSVKESGSVEVPTGGKTHGPKATGQPIPLWRGKDDKAVFSPTAGARNFSLLSTEVRR